jgi:hypothetical protein
MQISMMTDKYKNEYRERAKIILERKEIFKEEWMSLHKEFLKEFYSN